MELQFWTVKHTLKHTDFILLYIPEVELLSCELSLFWAKMKIRRTDMNYFVLYSESRIALSAVPELPPPVTG